MGDSIASVPIEPIANETNPTTNTSSAGTEDTPQFQTDTTNLAPSWRRPAQHRTTSSFTIGSSAHNQTNHHTTMSGDVEALLRQWGGGDSSNTGDLGNTAHSDGFVSSVVRAETVVDGGRDPIANILRGPLIDEESRAIDFDSEQESLDSADGGLALNSTVTSRHRRIASAGGLTSIPMRDLNLSSPSRGLDRVMSERVGMTIHRTQSDDLEGVALHSLDGRSSAIHDAARITNWSLVACELDAALSTGIYVTHLSYDFPYIRFQCSIKQDRPRGSKICRPRSMDGPSPCLFPPMSPRRCYRLPP